LVGSAISTANGVEGQELRERILLDVFESHVGPLLGAGQADRVEHVLGSTAGHAENVVPGG